MHMDSRMFIFMLSNNLTLLLGCTRILILVAILATYLNEQVQLTAAILSLPFLRLFLDKALVPRR